MVKEWRFWRRDNSLPKEDFSSPQDYWEQIRSAMREKADHNKKESLALFVLSISFSLSVPLLIAYGPGLFLGKVLPSILSALVAGITLWLQLRQPQKLWVLYRSAQRELENEKVHHDNAIGDYEAENRGKLLVARTASVALQVHQDWAKLIPDTATLSRHVESQGNEDQRSSHS